MEGGFGGNGVWLLKRSSDEESFEKEMKEYLNKWEGRCVSMLGVRQTSVDISMCCSVNNPADCGASIAL